MADMQVSPRGRAIAEALLSAAERLGYDPGVVRTTQNGYLVPVDVAELYGKLLSGEVSEEIAPAEAVYLDGTSPETGEDGTPIVEEQSPNKDWKNADIEQWASDHGIDLGGATKKADMLAKINDATNKEE